MKLKSTLLALAAFSTLNLQLPIAFAQGSLTPPTGAPTPVMKSLDQIEARTPVNTLAGDATASHIITLPGSYYLTSTINGNSGKSGIRIEADNVTLDLNGFTLEAVGGSLMGIQINLSAGQVNIRNGQLRFWPSGGILSTQAVNCYRRKRSNSIKRTLEPKGIWTAFMPFGFQFYHYSCRATAFC